jgi:adenylate cyclase
MFIEINILGKKVENEILTREHLGNRFEMEELQPAKVKGKEKPLHIYNVLRSKASVQVPGIILGDEPTRADG